MVPANNHAGILIYAFPITGRNRRGIISTARGILSYPGRHPRREAILASFFRY